MSMSDRTMLTRRQVLAAAAATTVSAAIPSGVHAAPTGAPAPAWAVGTPGEFDWRVVRADTIENAIKHWIEDSCCSDECFAADRTAEECHCRARDVEAERVPSFDAIASPSPGDWLRAGLGHICCRCGYEAFTEMGGRAVGSDAVCEDCLTPDEHAALGEIRDDEPAES